MAAPAVNFVKPDPETTRISECGRFVIVRHNTDSGPAYVLWHYQLAQTGFQSALDAQRAAQRIYDGYDSLEDWTAQKPSGSVTDGVS